MPLDENGRTPPGTIGRSVHQGDPLTVEQIRELPDGAEVVITWDGGNGPWPYRILVDFAGERRVENMYADALLQRDDQRIPFVTRGWGEGDAEWKAECYVSPRERAECARLRAAPPRQPDFRLLPGHADEALRFECLRCGHGTTVTDTDFHARTHGLHKYTVDTSLKYAVDTSSAMQARDRGADTA